MKRLALGSMNVRQLYALKSCFDSDKPPAHLE